MNKRTGLIIGAPERMAPPTWKPLHQTEVRSKGSLEKHLASLRTTHPQLEFKGVRDTGPRGGVFYRIEFRARKKKGKK